MEIPALRSPASAERPGVAHARNRRAHGTYSPLDYAVIAGYLIAITLFGSWFARFQKTTRDYFLTDRSVPGWAICCTIVATETSTLTFIGVPAQAYAGNMTFLQLVVGYIIGRIIVSALFMPAYFRGELLTTYELLQRRFGPSVKNLSASIFLLTRSLADGIRLYATALVITRGDRRADATGRSSILGAAMIVYTMRGGVSAVIWTDVVQLFVYVAGALLVFGSLLSQIDGGWSAVMEAGSAANKFQVLNFSLQPSAVYTIWAGLLGGVALTLSTHGTDQFLVQRLLSAKSLQAAQRGLVVSGFIVLRPVRAVPAHRRDALHVLSADAAAGAARTERRDPAAVHHPFAAQRRRRLHRRGDRGGGAVTVDQRDGGDDGQRLLCEVRPPGRGRRDAVARVEDRDGVLGRRADRRGAGRADDGAVGARRGALRAVAGLGIGARRVHHRHADARVGSRAMLAGMLAGLAAMLAVWLWTPIAWTWYAFIGASMTVGVAWVCSFVLPLLDSTRHRREPSSHHRENLLTRSGSVWNRAS